MHQNYLAPSAAFQLSEVADSCKGNNARVTRGIVTMATAGGDAGGSSSAAAGAVGADEGVGEILAFWFGDFMRPGYNGPPPAPSDEVAKARVWFSKNDDVDAVIRTRFAPLIPLAASGQLAAWEDTPRGALALLVLLDQFTRNSFRGSPEAFAQDHLALEIAKRAIDKGFDRQVPAVGRPFFYLPFEHAEDLAAQDRCIELMTQMVEDAPEGPVKGFFIGGLNFAHKHRDIIGLSESESDCASHFSRAMAAHSSSDFLQGALALACTLPPPSSAHYSASAPALPADSAVLPASALPFSPLSHSLLRMSATTKPLTLRATSPSPLRDLQRITERHVALARQFALGFAQEVAEAAFDHLADVYYALMLLGERLRLPLPGSPSASSSAEPLHLLMKQSNAPFAAVIPGDTVAELVVTQGIYSFLNLYNTVLIVRILLTWFPNAPSAIVSPLSTICDPYLNIFRGLIPPIGGTLDLSPILAFVVLSAFTNASVALPAEMPEVGASGEFVAGGRGGMLGGRRRRPVRLTREQREKMRAASRAAEQGQEA
ncbi:unnamed protein product [Closterium sp. Yama58-4]|nr:unnamed protein product [Closterium sp. Yama58-4]